MVSKEAAAYLPSGFGQPKIVIYSSIKWRENKDLPQKIATEKIAKQHAWHIIAAT